MSVHVTPPREGDSDSYEIIAEEHFELGTWHHYAFTYDSSLQIGTIYVNGKEGIIRDPWKIKANIMSILAFRCSCFWFASLLCNKVIVIMKTTFSCRSENNRG